MKKIYARITMGLEVTDEEFEDLKENITDPIHEDLAERFVKDGRLCKSGDSYIPDPWWDDFTNEWWE